MPERFRVETGPAGSVTAIAYPAAGDNRAGVTLILGHGAGANQASSFIVSFATALAARGIETVSFNFLYSEQGRRVPDPGPKLEACYRAVIEAVRNRKGRHGGKLAIGGKSMGGRIASQVAAAGVGGIAGLVYLGYPLHAPGRPDRMRAAHLSKVGAPMLFVQGSRDAFGTPEELRPVIEQIRPQPELYVVEGGDHSFTVLKKSGFTQEAVNRTILDKVAGWLRATIVT